MTATLQLHDTVQVRDHGAATIDAIDDNLRTRPCADVLWASVVQGDGSPRITYERDGLVATGEIKWDETVLRLDLTPQPREHG